MTPTPRTMENLNRRRAQRQMFERCMNREGFELARALIDNP